MQIQPQHFAQMVILFKTALQENHVSKEYTEEFLNFLKVFEDKVCVKFIDDA